MELNPRLRGQVRQSVAITPQVIQSIKMLKYGHEELLSYLKEKEEKNPLIEVILSAPAPEGSAVARQPPARPAGRDLPARTAGTAPHRGGGGNPAGDLRSIEETFASPISLREHLLQQAELGIPDRVDRLIAFEIIESIEPDGYLRRDPEEITETLGITSARFETVLAQVQRFEPTGVGARDLRECLTLQLREKGLLRPAMTRLLARLDLLAAYDLPGLAKVCGVDQAGVVAMVRDIRQLDPRPGKCFDSEATLPALPDVNVEIAADGGCHVELNTALLPRVLVNREYYAEMRAVSTGAAETRFVTDCINDANWLTRNLDLRANTLLKVATEIVKRQHDFFLLGVEHIRPLCQGDVAGVLGMHRSTVCRAISGKYMMTNRGLFELKYFFSNAITSAKGDEDFSAESIRAKIRHLINAEQPGAVLSDDAIVAALRRDGADIARRTIAKYREMMGIPASSVRRRQQRAATIENRVRLA